MLLINYQVWDDTLKIKRDWSLARLYQVNIVTRPFQDNNLEISMSTQH